MSGLVMRAGVLAAATPPAARPLPAPATTGSFGPVTGRARVGRTKGRMITVSATTRWTDSGIDVISGDVVSFSVAGTVSLGDDRSLGAEGDLDAAAPARRGAPMPDRPAGALIGRIGTSPDDTFFIGAEQLPFRVRTSGRLYPRRQRRHPGRRRRRLPGGRHALTPWSRLEPANSAPRSAGQRRYYRVVAFSAAEALLDGPRPDSLRPRRIDEVKAAARTH